VYRRLPLLAEPRAYRAWVYRIASRIAFRHAKRRWPISAEQTDLPAATAERPSLDEIAQANENISALSPNIRAAVALHYYEQMSISRVAAILGIPEGTAKSRIAAGLESLRRTLGEKNA
jgi:RNA polymerase sigma-70 factor (ECF subfamily)